jgi:hypothetical protein
MNDNGKSGLILILLLALVWSVFFHKDTYEGNTAEDWFNAYDQAETDLQTTREAYEEFTTSMENEITLKSCIKRSDNLTQEVLKRICAQSGDNCLNTIVNSTEVDNLMASNKESHYTCFNEYLENK